MCGLRWMDRASQHIHRCAHVMGSKSIISYGGAMVATLYISPSIALFGQVLVGCTVITFTYRSVPLLMLIRHCSFLCRCSVSAATTSVRC
jgi:hypothetical protein